MKKILLADELSICRQLLSLALRHHGYDVVVALDGPGVIEAVKTQRPDLAILGLHLPKMDGLKVVRALRADADSANLPIFILTHEVSRNPILEAGQAGVQAYILKSQFDLDSLLKRIEKHIGPAKAADKKVDDVWGSVETPGSAPAGPNEIPGDMEEAGSSER